MKISPILLLFATIGCGSGTQPAKPAVESGDKQVQQQKVATPELQVAAPEHQVATPAEKAAAAKPDATTKIPDAAAVNKRMTPAQLELGDPVANSIGMVLVPIPAGEFEMGSPASDRATAEVENENPQHLVKITKPFYLSVFEVTQQQYEKVMGVRPWQGKKSVHDGADYPATYVNWVDAAAFCRKLSEKEGVEYRLPTEAQWEYACRAGTSTPYSFGDDASELGQYAWYYRNWNVGEQYAQRVGQKLPNSWGLYDMHGNLLEWCQDWLGNYENAAVDDPSGPTSGSSRVLRGGSFNEGAVNCRSAFRNSWQPGNRHFNIGFRVARTYP